MPNPIRVLITDDSPFYRRLFSDIFANAPDIEVVGTAHDPLDAREKIKQLDPDVLTLDVEMPHMDGISFLEKIMSLRPMPVLMVSSLTQKGADITLQALSIGAVDCLGKPATQLSGKALDGFAKELCDKVRAAAQARVGRSISRTSKPSARLAALPERGARAIKLIAIGSSTGGVEALNAILPRLPGNMPPIVIAQHMPPGFTASFAKRLDSQCRMTVKEATDGTVMSAGHACLAPGGWHLQVSKGRAGEVVCHLNEEATVNGHRPSVDVLFDSVMEAYGAASIGVILTGMGSDGAEGLRRMRNAGAATFGQDESSSVVYGMPRAAKLCGAVESEIPLERLAEAILAACK